MTLSERVATASLAGDLTELVAITLELREELALARRERERYLIFVEDMLNSRDGDVRRRAKETLNA